MIDLNPSHHILTHASLGARSIMLRRRRHMTTFHDRPDMNKMLSLRASFAPNLAFADAAAARYDAVDAEPGVAALLGCGMASSSVAMLATYPLNL
eukprot:207467-Chlamydomonas_euryale.AAC.2